MLHLLIEGGRRCLQDYFEKRAFLFEIKSFSNKRAQFFLSLWSHNPLSVQKFEISRQFNGKGTLGAVSTFQQHDSSPLPTPTLWKHADSASHPTKHY